MDKWPQQGDCRVPAVSDGLFEVGHARLLRILSRICPDQTMAAFQASLEERMSKYQQPAGASEKAEQATVAEVSGRGEVEGRREERGEGRGEWRRREALETLCQ
jgi:hypothetical protein